ncbi:hypothetical protein QVD17_19759 [Tagetes erecta]|uniref:Uncharacterized protein n=1 Tax=Tagetes erecta TaxID=13708 RepID=A0AAD8KK13_TARER|nr:hypothetical protein QVD17_19759 [Tagetes erecta]
MSRRSAGFDNFPSDIASPIVAIATNRPFNTSRWIMKGFIFNLVKGKRFKFLMYPIFLQLLINDAHPVIREEGFEGGILYTEDMNALSYRKMSIGNVENVQMFDYMRDIANNEEDIREIYHHISQGEVLDPLDLVDEIPDNLLDDDEYFARYREDEGDNAENDGDQDDDNNDDDNVVENVEVDTNSDQTEEEEIEMDVSGVELISVENVMVTEEHEPINVVQIAQEAVAEVETVAPTVDETEVVEIIPNTCDIATSSALATEQSKQPKEYSPKASNERKKKRLAEFWVTHQKNTQLFKELDEEYERLKVYYEELQAECNTLRAEKEVLENWLKEEETEHSESDKEFIADEDVGVSETPRDVTSKAEGKRKIDEVIEIVEEDVYVKKARTEEAVQVEPVQAETVQATEVLNISEEADTSGFETEVNVCEDIPIDLDARFAYLERMKYNPVYLNGLSVSQINEEYEQCVNAQDRVDGDKKEFVVEPGEWTPLQESLNIDDLPPEELYHQNPEDMTSTDMHQWLQSRNYPYKTLKRLKKESLKKIVVSFQKSEKMHNRMLYLDYNNPQYFELTKRFKVLEPKEIPLMALPVDAHKKRKDLFDMFPSEMKAYHIPMDVRESWHRAAIAGDIVRSLLSKGQSVADLLDSMIVPEKSKDVKIIAWKYDEVFDAFLMFITIILASSSFWFKI